MPDKDVATASRIQSGWTLVALGPQATQVNYRLDVEVAPYPTFLVRTVLLDGVPRLLRELTRRVKP